MEKRNKVSNSTMDLFLETIIEMIVKGQSRTDILRFFSENENPALNKSERSVDGYITRARKTIIKRYQPDRERLLADSLAKLDDLFKKNYSIQDYRECRQVVEARAKLTGINAPEKKQLTGADGGPIQTETTSKIDYESLSDEVLTAIANAERKTT